MLNPEFKETEVYHVLYELYLKRLMDAGFDCIGYELEWQVIDTKIEDAFPEWSQNNA